MIKRLKLKNIFKCLAIIIFSILVFTPNNAYSGTAIAWPSTAEEQGSWLPVLIGGSPFRDYESPDVSANTAVGAKDDIASGYDGTNGSQANCNPDDGPNSKGDFTCGPETSAFQFCERQTDPSTADDQLFFRLRVDGNPLQGGGAPLGNGKWNFLVDIDGDGFKEYWVLLDGNADEIRIIYEDADNQALTGGEVTTATLDTTFFRVVQIPGSPGSPGMNTEYYIDVQVPTSCFTTAADGCTGTQQITCDTPLGLLFSTSDSNVNPLQKDFIPNCPDETASCTFSDSTPVTLSYFYTSKSSERTKFEWSTATEVGNIGFNIYGVINGSKQRLNESTILSKAVDSLSPLDYRTTIENSDADSFYISDIDLRGKEKFHGPFTLGKSYGEKVKAEKIDWIKINSEINIKKAISVDNKKLKALKKTASLKSKSSKLIKTSAVTLESLYPKASIKVTDDGVYRVYYQDLADIGLDLSGVDINSLALTHKGVPEPIYISSTDEVLGAGDYFEFAGQSINTLYTDTNVYILEVNSGIAERVSINSKSIKNNATFEQSYLEKLVIGNNNTYTFSSPSSDPWIDSRLFATPSSPVTKVYSFDLDNLASPNGGSLDGTLWGLTDFPLSPDHHVNIKLNGVQVEDKIFNGLTLIEVNADLNKLGVTLLESSNQLEVNLPADTAASFDIVDIDSFTVSFERNFIANDGKLVYSDSGDAFEIQNLLSSDLIVYSKNGASISKHTNLEITENAGIYSVKFAGDKNNIIKYYVFEEGSILSPELEITPETDDLNTGEAQYLTISHPAFINDLGALVAEREKQFSVKITDVEAVYTEFNGGIFDPEAIRKYIDFAVNNMGTQHVLLVGGDSYDYLDFTGNSSLSFIPTFYGKVHTFANFAPSDSLIADIDGDDVQDVSIGRFPVRTSEELANIIEKTLTYPLVNNNNAVFAADADDGLISFSNDSDILIQQIPADWSVDRAYIEGSTVADAKAILIDSINDGRALTSFFGHSSFGVWTFSGLFNLGDAQNLTNYGLPTVVTQYGCWNTYFVDPALNTLGHKFLLSGTNGAAAVTGPTSLTDAGSDRVLGNILLRNLFEGKPIGTAIMEAKQEMANSGQKRIDVIIGWNLLGDPALVITE